MIKKEEREERKKSIKRREETEQIMKIKEVEKKISWRIAIDQDSEETKGK